MDKKFNTDLDDFELFIDIVVKLIISLILGIALAVFELVYNC